MPIPAFEMVILPYPPTPALPAGGGPAAIPLYPGRVELDGLGGINRAVERDLLSFRTGDLTFQVADGDGAIEEALSPLGPTDRWQILLMDRDATVFRGVLLGQGSIRYDRKDKRIEITAYGPTKILQDVSAESIKRTFATISLGANANAGATTLTLSSTAGLLSGDILHLSDFEINREDVTILQITSSTVISLLSPLQNSYTVAGARVEVSSPYYRYKRADFLITQLFAAAGVPLSPPILNNSQFAGIAPSLVNVTGLDLSAKFWGGPSQQGSRTYVTVDAKGTYYQANADDSWTKEDALSRPWVDWSRYYRQSDAAPTTFLRCPVTAAEAEITSQSNQPHASGWDFKSATKATFYMDLSAIKRLRKRTSADGTTWAASTVLKDLGTFVGASFDLVSAEYDPVRNGVYIFFSSDTGGHSFYYDIDSDVLSDLTVLDDPDVGAYVGFCYVPEKDYTLSLLTTDARGSIHKIAAHRGKERLWSRDFPRAKAQTPASQTLPMIWATQTMRYVNGRIYGIIINDAAMQLISSADDFQTFSFGKVADSTTNGVHFAARIGDGYLLQTYRGTMPKNYQVLKPFFNAIVEYADFSGKSIADALNELAVLTNSIYWVDDDLIGHVVARDLLPAAQDVPDLDGSLMALSELHQWDEARQYAEVSGAGIVGRAGSKAFVDDAIRVSSDFLPNAIFADLLAQEYVNFFGKRRRLLEASAPREVALRQPLDRVIVGGRRYLVYESTDNLADLSVDLKLLEDA